MTAALGVRRVVNAAATLTALGGVSIPEEVTTAMAAAARHPLDMHELIAVSGEELATLTHNEAAYVTCGAASALAHALLGCITQGDPAAIADMPDGRGRPTQVVMHCAHRIPYDRVIDLIGCQIVQLGNALQTFEWELEHAIGPETAAVVWVAGSHLPPAALDLEATVRIAHERGVPVIVDAAAQLPPVSNLWHFTTACGADAAVFSGGKALRGPQASGLLVGSAPLVQAARANGTPHQRLLRAMKVGKEEIAGLVAAVRRYVTLDHDGLVRGWEQTVEQWVAQLNRVRGVLAERAFPNEAGQPTPRMRLTIDAAAIGMSASEVAGALWKRDPRIAVLPGDENAFFVTPDTLGPGEDDLVITALLQTLDHRQEVAA